jgi:hypothetical protein
MADRWSGPVGRLGVETSDGRLIERSGFYSRSLPLPIDWQEYTDEGHDKAVTVGTMDHVEILDDGTIWAGGDWLDAAVIPQVGRARALVDAGVVYPSVQAAGCEYEYMILGGGAGGYVDGEYAEGDPFREVCVFTSFELAKVTLVSVQALPDLRISDGDQQPTGVSSLTAAGVRSSGWDDLPVADADVEWDGTGAADRVAAWAGVDQDGATEADWAKYARAFLWQDPDADPMTKGAYGFGVADIVDGELTLIPRGVYAVAGVLSGAHGGTDIPEAQQKTMQGTVRSLYGKIAKALEDDTIEAPFALIASAAPSVPPMGWFADPTLTGPTPITIDGSGRVFGHAALWGTCHIGLPGCITPPQSPSEYAYFRTGATLTEGGEIPTGKLTVGGGHADGQLGYAATAEHYDNACAAVATVAAGEDEYGIWVAGALLASATEQQVEALRQSPLSGDWRDIGGALEMVACHAVNTPGFPVPRPRAAIAASGRQLSLVAAGMVSREAPKPAAPRSQDEFAREFAAQILENLKAKPTAFAYVSAPAGFDVAAEDLRAEFARHGMQWPTIMADIGGTALAPFEVAEGCVRGMLGYVAPDEVPAVVAPDRAPAARARMALLRLDKLKAGA